MDGAAVTVAAALFACLCAAGGFVYGRLRGAGRVQYVDTSGQAGTAVRVFSDVWRGKTLNFKLDEKHSVIVPHVTVPHGLAWMERVTRSVQEIRRLSDIKGTEQEMKAAHVMMWGWYREAVRCLYQLTKPFARFGYKRALHSKTKDDMVWTLDVLEQVADFWTLVKKKLEIMAQGSTLKQTDGEQSTWSGLTLQAGKRVIMPRFANSSTGANT